MRYFITTWMGHKIDIDNPNPDNLHIADIAHALSLQCRFAGHCNYHYSVAQHSVLVSYLSGDFALEGLMHDATETYLVDLPRPIKYGTELGRLYSICEDGLAKVLASRFHLKHPLPDIVKKADDIALATELSLIMSVERSSSMISSDETTYRHDKLPDNLLHLLEPISPSTAENRFLDRFNQLTK